MIDPDNLSSDGDGEATGQLAGKLLIAMPGMGDPRFAHSVICICAHSRKGAMGIVVNKRAEGLHLSDVLEQVAAEDETPEPPPRDLPVHFGGPVETNRGFVLHSPEFQSDISTLEVAPGIAMTGTLDVLEALGGGTGPRQALLALGYAGWGPSQLEDEIAANGWLTCDAVPDLVFGGDAGGKWQAALRSLGIEPQALSASAGRA